MKWLLVSIVVIIFGVAWASTDEADDEYCPSQERHQYDARQKCIENFVNFTEFKNDAQQKLDLSDNASIIEFATKYCPIRMQFMNCSTLMLNLPEECFDPQFRQWKSLNLKKMSAVLHFLCNNNAATLLELIENDGLKTIAQIGETKFCSNVFEDLPYNEFPENTQITQPYCEALGNVTACFTMAIIENHQRLENLFGNFVTSIRQELECPE